MNPEQIKTVGDVAAWRLCVGCGVCAYVCPSHVSLMDFTEEGIRPVIKDDNCSGCRECLTACPAVETSFVLDPEGRTIFDRKLAATRDAFTKEWGQVLEIWEGNATDEELRFKGASGGALTALALFCLERGGMDGVLHIGADSTDPVRNRTRFSRSRADLLAAAGSRYSPASVGNGLHLVEEASAPCAIIGKPTEIAGIQRARTIRPGLDEKIGVLLSFFCAESPSTAGSIALLERMGVEPSQLEGLRYRGCGWPGHFAPTKKGETTPAGKIPYRDSWAFLQAFRPWAVNVWPDGTGEVADISCGDPWYEEPDGKNPGFSLIVVRTARGQQLLKDAVDAGYLSLRPAERWKLEKSQGYLLKKKGEVAGRRLVLAAFRLPRTRFHGSGLYHCWSKLSVRDKLRSLLGTVRRIFSRGLTRRLHLDLKKAVPVKAAMRCNSEESVTSVA